MKYMGKQLIHLEGWNFGYHNTTKHIVLMQQVQQASNIRVIDAYNCTVLYTGKW